MPRFVDATRAILYKSTHDWSDLLFRESVRDDIREAFDELDDKDDLTKKTIWEELKSKIADAHNAIRLKAAGLAARSRQLTAKLKSFWNAFSAFREGGTVKLLKRVLKWMNKILGSLLAAVGAGEAVKELKELVEGEIEDALDDANA